jgi:hypothetical protein
MEKKQFSALTKKQQKAFKKSASAIANWLKEKRLDPETVKKMQFNKRKESLQSFLKIVKPSKTEIEVKIDRIPDSDGVQGDVTDIRITFGFGDLYSNLNISLKHRHEALKIKF